MLVLHISSGLFLPFYLFVFNILEINKEHANKCKKKKEKGKKRSLGRRTRTRKNEEEGGTITKRGNKKE